MSFHLAQINVAKIAYPMDGPHMADFVAALDNINALADRSDGFVWRMVGDGGEDASAVRIEGAPELLINMSVWTDITALRAYVYKSAHAAVMARKAKWFPPLARAHMALWWIPAGTLPSLQDAAARLALIDQIGPSANAFTFDAPFDAAGASLTLAPIQKNCA
jgi:hypothetical protein